MQELEQTTKAQFAKVFAATDWRLFKEVAEFNLAEAATLKTRAFAAVPEGRKLLMRNVRKRLLIGVGTELLVKAAYLKLGYGINRPKEKNGPKLPYRLADVPSANLNPNDTFTLGQLLDNLKKIVQIQEPTVVAEGLVIARIFRNKEGHVVTGSHKFDPSSYQKIAKALMHLYAGVFAEQLKVRFSFAVGENGVWRVTP